MLKQKYFLQLSPDPRPQPRLACDLQQTLQEVTTLPFPSEHPPRKARVQPPRPDLLLLLLPHPPPSSSSSLLNLQSSGGGWEQYHRGEKMWDEFRSSHWSRFQKVFKCFTLFWHNLTAREKEHKPVGDITLFSYWMQCNLCVLHISIYSHFQSTTEKSDDSRRLQTAKWSHDFSL